jgi:hypothetical protein
MRTNHFDYEDTIMLKYGVRQLDGTSIVKKISGIAPYLSAPLQKRRI